MMILKMLPRWFIHTTIASDNGKALVEKKKKKRKNMEMILTELLIKVFVQSEKT